MSRAISVAAVIVLILCLCMQAEAQDKATPGQVTRVTCKDDSSQSYACYVPSKYTKGKKWPILYCFSPGGNGQSFTTLFKDVCERRGWIVVGSNNAKNGPNAPIIAATKAMWKDTHDRFSLSDKRCYAAGFSGGSGMAFGMAESYPDHFAGVMPMAVGSSWADRTPELPKYVSVCFIIGSSDAVSHVEKHAKVLKGKGNKVEIKKFPGGHTLPPKDVAEAAVEWLVKVGPKGSGSGGKSGKPTELALRSDVAKRLQGAVRNAGKGNLGSALRFARKVLEDERAKEDEKADAKYIKEEIEKHVENLFAQADDLLKGKMPYEAKELLKEVRKALTGMDEAKKAEEKIAAIDSNGELKDELAAGRIFAKALKYEAKGKEKQARKYFEQVIKKYPETEYAKRAKEKL